MSAICRELLTVFTTTPVGPNAETLADLIERDEPLPETDTYVMLAKAARGDKASQVELAELAAHRVLACLEVDPLATLDEGLMFARMAAVQGSSHDKMRAACLLSIGAELATGLTRTRYAAEAIAWMEIVSDVGDEYGDKISAGVVRLTDHEQPENLALAKKFYARIRAALEVE